MAVSTRGFRSILSRSRRSTKKKTNKSLYSNLPEDSGATTPTTSTTTISTTTTTTKKKKKATTAMVSERRPISVNVTVLTSTSTGTTTASNELECANGAPIDSNDSNTPAQDTEQAPKQSHDPDSNIFEATRNAAILMVQNASSMTDMMAKTLASKSITATTPTRPESPPRVKKLEEEKIEVEMDDTDFEKQLHKTVEEACRWGNALVETSKERVHNAVSKTHEAASDLVEESLSLSEQAMVSTEESSVAAFQGGLALSPVLEHTSERLELLYESAIAEVQEFLLEHWAILKDYIVAHYYYDTTTTKATTTTTTTPQKPPLAARDDDAVLHVAIEVRMTS